ncbi:IPT/TIG domain-containing protein [Aestuariibaculum marinum]|uniref:IPT/TIG domain-containing protein n=1 Tax=Aestuariibaculum marinum TaxID=2683592 RepID=A0A8J6PZJ2_9FLAO|nr:IPT/TIG domain-containing protein [Aestuariibaculum marinum]MBD0825172.1 IPT/TIG domain-containing protein [Aestuariibaculum marinum]
MCLNITFNKRFYALCLILAFIGISFYSCDSDGADGTSQPFDPSKPVEVSGFIPSEGGAGQRLVIYGTNFGTNPDIVKVFIGGKEATVINVNGEALYCLVPSQAFDGDIEVQIGEEGSQVVAYSEENFNYQRKMVVSTVIGYKNDRGDEPWKDGVFKSDDPNEMASGFWRPSFMKFDPLNPKHLWTVFDGNNGLYLFNFADSTVTKVRSDLSRPRSIDFTANGQDIILAESFPGENDRNTSLLTRAAGFQDREVLTRYKGCAGASVHPNGEYYFNSFEKGQFFRYDLNKYFEVGLGDKDFEQLFVVQDPGWEFKIFIHPTGNYAYIVVINKHYILRCDYNWDKKRFNQPYLVCGQLGSAGYQDGVGAAVRLRNPYQGVFVKNNDYVEAGKPDEYDFYFTEQFNHDIRKLTPEGSVTTFAGRGSSSINPDPYGYVNGDLREEARFDRPSGLAYNEEEGAFYIGDQMNHRIRKIALEEKEE